MQNEKLKQKDKSEQLTDRQIISQNIAFFRKKLGLSQTALAKQLQYSNKNISKWELGETTPDVFTIKKLAAIFGVSVDILLNPITDESKQAMQTHTVIPTRWKIYMMLLVNAIVFLSSCILFYILKSADFTGFKLGLIFLYNLPIASLICFIFLCCIKKKVEIYSLSLMIWLIALCFHISFITAQDILYIYLIALGAQLLTVFIAKLINSGKIIELNKILIKKIKR